MKLQSWWCRALITGGLVAASSMVSADAAAQTLRFSTTTSGAIASTGNTLGLSKELDRNGPGTEDSIGTFIALDLASQDTVPGGASAAWPLGTTNDWTMNGSAAMLDLPANAEVLYAELVWAASYAYGTENVVAFLDQPVSFRSSNNTSVMVAPDPTTAVTTALIAPFPINYYLRSADVTSFVQANGGGMYLTSAVPGTQDALIDELNAGGWSLVVAYRGEDQPIRNLSVFVGGSFVNENTEVDYTVTGFCAPPTGAVEGRVVISAMEGDADRDGDALLIAPTNAGPFVNLSGPNNPVDNFFCSQLNDYDGLLDTQGDFGNSNHDALNAVNVSGGRQGWDLTTVPVSTAAGHLFNNQESAVIRTTTADDSYFPTLVALEIDVKAPDFSKGSGTTSTHPTVSVGDQFTVTAVLNNTGDAEAQSLLFRMALDPGLQLDAFTTDGANGDINGAAVVTADLMTGVEVGSLPTQTMRTVGLTFTVTSAPANGQSYIFAPKWEHSFEMCNNQAPIATSHSSMLLAVNFMNQQAGVGGAGGQATTGVGGQGAAGGQGGQGGENANGDALAKGGACSVLDVGASNQGRLAWALGLLGAAAMLRRRRR